MSGINWDELMPYMKLEPGKQYELECIGWKQQDKFKDEKTGQLRPGIELNVVKENGKETDKSWTITAMKAISKLRPIIEEAEINGSEMIRIKVMKVGEGKNTVYDISKL